MYGVVTTDPTVYGLVIEYFELGDLRTLLNAKDTHISDEQKTRILLDIAQVSESEPPFIRGVLHLLIVWFTCRGCNTLRRTGSSTAT